MSSHAAIGALAAEAHGGWHTWGVPGLFLLGLLDGAGFPTMGGPDVVLIYLCMHASAARLCWIALVAALSEAIGSVVLLQLARAGSDYAQKKLRIPQRWWNSLRKHAAKLPPFWLCALLGMIPPPLPKKPVPIICGALQIPTVVFVPGLALGRWIGFLLLGALGAIYGEKSMTFVAEHKVLFVRLLVGFLFLLAVAAALLYHFRPKWMFPPDDEECGVETDDADGNGSSHTRGLEPRVVNRGRNVYIEV